MNKQCLGCMEEYNQEYDVCPHCGYVEGTEVEEAVHMEPGTTLADRYTIGKVLGYGGFGVTYIAWDKLLEQKVAIKEYLPSEFSTRMPGDPTVTVFSGDRNEQFNEGLDKFVEEAKRLSKFQNEAGIVKVFDSFKSNNTAYIVMEYLDGETLTSYMEREGLIPEDKAIEMLAPVMVSLQTVHEAGILHRDIAPDNIFLTKNGEVKLIDFGASRYATTSHSRSLTVIIKPGYSPEEQYRSRGDQGPHTDVYALAAVMYKMITGITPPDALERRAVIETKKKELLKDIHKTNKTISPNIENAILNAMNVQVEDRTADILSFMTELNSTTPVKRRYGKIKKIDVYAWPLWMKIVIPAVVVAFLTTAILLVTGIIDFPSLFSSKVVVPEGMVIVPDVEGMTADEALEAINNAGLTPSPEGNIESEYLPAGTIVLQTPMGGSFLEKYGKVLLTVSSGKGVVEAVDGTSTVPYVIWDTKDVAIAKLFQAGLAEPIIETEYDENVPEGQVISQSVSTGTKVDEGTQITIVVSKGPKPFAMPNVVGKTKDAAENALASKGLAVYFEYVTDDSVAANTVLGQNVAEGTMVQKGDKITLKISTKTPTVKVSNVVGKSQANATTTLENQGFTVKILENYDDTVPKGNVISQNPVAETSCIKGSTITIVVSKGIPSVTVPNMVGKTEVAAKSDLTDLRLGVNVEYKSDDTVESGKVISQSPAANESHPQGTVVTIYVSTGKKTVSVPNVVGQTESSATTILNVYKLNSVVEYQSHDTIEAGNVISQNPAANTEHPQGTTITIYVSTGKPIVTVPNVVGKTKTAAVSTLESTGLTVTISSEHSLTVSEGTIISQSVKSGNQVVKGTQIEIVVSLGNPPTLTEGNFTYFVISNKATITGFNKNYEGDVAIPKTLGGYPVTSIGDSAFSGCTKLTSIIIPNSVTSIGLMAFEGCSSLTSITIPNSVTYIGDGAFEDCSSLTSVTIPNSVTIIGNCAFYYCTSLTNITIPNSVTMIGNYAFWCCSNLTNITIPNSVKIIGEEAFNGCTSLTGIWVDENNKYYCSDSKGVVYTKDKTELVRAPGGLSGSYTIPNSVTSIEVCAFWCCSNLTSITIPNSVTSIGSSAFYKCTNLTSITIPHGVKSIDEFTFSDCTSLTSFTIPDSVTSIGEGAFMYCTSLTNITISNSVTSIDRAAFMTCNITSITIPNSVIYIDDQAFYNCYNLTTVYFESEAQKEKFKDCFKSNVNLVVK